jgi:O-antigen/teichoic acid export membrane protein
LSTVQRIAKNTTALIVAQVASYLLAFFFTMYTARYLGPASFGILSFALAFTTIFAIFGDLGLSSVIIREVARDKSLAPKYLSNITLMKIILVVITFGLIVITINLMGYPEETIKVVYLLGLSAIFTAFTQMFYSIFQAFERMEFQGIGQMLNAALILGGVMLAIKYGLGVVGFASVYTITSIIGLAYGFAVMKLKLSNSISGTKVIEFDWSFWKLTIKEMLPFGLTSIFVTIYTSINLVMLSLMKGDEIVGWYSAAYRLVLTLAFIPAAFMGALFPVMSRLHISSYESLKIAYERSFKYLLIIGFPIGVGTTLLANRIIMLIYGLEYAPAIIALQILVWWQVLAFINGASATLLNSINKQMAVAKMCAFLAVLNILLNLALIPKYGHVGAAAAQVATAFSGSIILLVLASRLQYRIANRSTLILAIKVIMAGSLMGVFTAYFSKLNLAILIISSALVYFALVYLFRVADKTDIDLAKHLIGRTEHSKN